MCKFHQQVANAIAEDPATGKVDTLRYSIALTALSRYWLERRLPGMDYLSGFSNFELAVPAVQSALSMSGMETDLPAIAARRIGYATDVRAELDDLIEKNALSLQTLNLPQNPLSFKRPLNLMIASLFEGDPAKPLTLVSKAADPKHEPMRRAIAGLLSRPAVAEKLEQMLDDSVAELITRAPGATNGRLQSIYNSFPRGLRTAFGECAAHGGGGAVLGHAGCAGAMLLSGGAAASVMGPAMYIASPAIAAGLDYYFNWRVAKVPSFARLAAVGVISVGVAAGVNRLLPHDHEAGAHTHMSSEKAIWFESLPKPLQAEYLGGERAKFLRLTPALQNAVREESARENITPELFLLTCGGENEVSQKVSDYLRSQRADAPQNLAVR